VARKTKIKGFDKLVKQMETMQKGMEKLDVEQFCEAMSRELAARLLAKVIKRTPVGRYPKSTGKKGGTLRRGWTARTEVEARSGEKVDVDTFVESLTIDQSGTVYTITIINPVNYALYREFGHRTRDGKGFVKGAFMLTISENELQEQAPELIEAKLQTFLAEVFGG